MSTFVRSGSALLLFLALMICLNPALATRIFHQPLEEVLPATQTVVTVRVLQVGKPVIETFGQSVEFTAEPLRTLFGKPPKPPLVCTYSQGIPHVRNGIAKSPLVTGSGCELNTKPGAKVVFLLASEGILLRIEPYESIARILKWRNSFTGEN